MLLLLGAAAGDTLLQLADEALLAGDRDGARSRYTRLLELGPRPELRARALVGLGRIDLDEGDPEAARERFEQALEAAPDSVPALVGLASVEPGRERELLERAIRIDFFDPEPHARLQAATGPAPRDAGDPEARAEAHPYDPWASWQAGVALAKQGRNAEAVAWFDSALWMGDLDPLAASRAFVAQKALPEARWSRRVPVHLFADETIRRHPGWEFRLRHALQRVSLSLKPLMETAFTPVFIRGFDAAGARDDLPSLEAAWAASGVRLSPTGIVAVFTERPPPRRRGRWRLGQAEFLGRRMTVRLASEAQGAHTLAHELLHLYGGMHLSSRAESLMNPSGTSMVLDPYNAAIVRSLSGRRFGPGGQQANVFAVIDLETTTRAYLQGLERNAVLRKLNLAEGRVREVLQLDPHLGDVCTFVAQLLWRQEERVQALTLLEAAAALYGPKTPRGRAARKQADELRAALKRAYGVD